MPQIRVTISVAHERELVAQEKANKQPDAGVIYSWPDGSIRKDLRRRTIHGQYVTKLGGYCRRHGQWSPAGHPAKCWLEADVIRGRQAVWRRAGRRYVS